MSRLAKKPIILPQGSSAEVKPGEVFVRGPKGEKTLPILPFTTVTAAPEGVTVASGAGHKQARANVGTMWSLIRNAAEGVTGGFTKILEIEGVGYKAALEGKNLMLSLGYVHPVKYPIAEGITVTVEKNVITITGTDKDLVGRTAAQIREQKKPEPYKGKGIRYRGEVIVRKVGKKAAGATAA